MLTGARLRNDPPLAKPPGKQDLPDRIVDLMRSGMIEVFALEIDRGIVLLAQSRRQVQWRGTTDIIPQQFLILLLKGGLLHNVQVTRPKLLYIGIKHLGDKRPSKCAVITPLVRRLDTRFNHSTVIYSLL